MHNTYITSTVTLRTRGSLPFSYNNDYYYASTQRCPFSYSPSRTSCCCCYCCASSVCRVPISTFDLYGCRQSSLIQSRKLSLGGFDRGYYSRVSSRDVDRREISDKGCGFREKSVKKGGLRKRMVIEERSESCDFGGVDETEALLSLLSEDVGEECFRVRRERKRVVKKPVVEKTEEVEVRGECKSSKKKRSDLGFLESGEYELVIRKRGDRRSERFEKVDDEKREGSSRMGNRKLRIMDQEEGKEDSVRKTSRKKVVHDDESQLLSRKRVSSASVREEEKEEDLQRREEHRHRVRKDGSSCSSYYSLSSNNGYESENDIELREGRVTGESSNRQENIVRSENDIELREGRVTGESSNRQENIVRSEIDHQETGDRYQRHADYREDVGTSRTKKINSQETHVGSSVVESEFRKKSEKKLLDETVEDVVYRKGTKEMESELCTVRESGHGKSSKSYVKYDATNAVSSGSTKLDIEKQQVNKQTGVGISSQYESKMKYKHSGEMTSTNSGGVKTSNASQQVKGSKNENSAREASNSSQTAVGLSNRENEIQRYSRKATVVSDTIDIDVRKTSISLQETETSVKKMEDHSSILSGSAYDAENKQHHDEFKGQVEPRGKSQQLTIGSKDSSLKMQSDDQLREQRENVNLSYGSYMDTEKRKSQSQAYFIKRDDSKYRTDELTETSVSHSGDSSAIEVLDNDKTKAGMVESGQSSKSGTIAPSVGRSKITTDKVSDESLQSGQAAVHGRRLGRSAAIQDEDAIGSAARLEESSEQYVGKFVDNVRQEVMSSETHTEKKTYKTALVREEEEERKSLIENTSVDSESNEHDSKRLSQGSGVKGPSDEMWKVEESVTGEQSATVLQEDENKGENVVSKRIGRSLWNVIGDVLRLRWSPRSETQSTGGKSGGRSSPIQSAGSETWFSGHEAEEKEEAAGKKESASMTQESLFEIRQEEKIHSKFEEGSSSSALVGHLKHGINVPSSSVAIQSSSATTGVVLPPTIEPSRNYSGGISNASEFRLRRSPVVRSVSDSASEGGEANLSGSGMSEQLTSGGSGEQSGPATDVAEQKRRGKLLRKDQIVRDRFEEWEEAFMIEDEQRKLDETFMREALLEAQKAGDNWEVPVGAVLVHNGNIIARGYNLVEELRDSTAHAEMICIREASNLLRTWRLSETTLYVTLEPCPMCAGAILQARIDTIVWGAPNKLLGADGSWIRLFPSGDGGNSLEQSDKPAAPVHPFHPKITIRRGVLASECADTMKQFFQLRRKNKNPKPETPQPSSRVSISQHPSKFLKRMHHAFNIIFCL